jgi:hypothetical protein
MIKALARTLFTAVALLSLFTTSSALGARALHRETSNAGGRQSHQRHAGRRSRHRPVVVAGANTTAANMLLGDEAVESLHGNLIAGQAEAFSFAAGPSGATGTVHVYIDSRNTARTLIVGLYTNAGGHPGSLLSTGSLSSPQAGAWDTAAVAPVQVVPGTTYWLVVLGRGGTLRYRDRVRGPCKAETSAQTKLGALTAVWRAGTLHSTCPISAYVTPVTATLPVGPPEPVELTPPTESTPPVEPPPPVEPTPPIPPAVPAAPVNSAPPTIGETATEGQLLSATAGAWTGSPTSYAYRWQDCKAAGESCSNVSGATASSYKLAASDVGHTLRVVVTATNAGGSGSASSAATATVVPPAPTNTVLPTVSGSAVEGQTLSASSGTWSGSPTSYAYQWQDCNALGEGCLSVAGATASSYRLAASNDGSTVRVVVSASNAGGSMQATSAATGIVLPPAPANTVLPSVSGSAVEGQTLSASSGTWSGSPTSYAYRWQDCNALGEGCLSVSGATASSYTLAASDIGRTVRVVVSASNVGGVGSATSAATATVVADPPPPPPAPANTALPSVSGSAVEAQTLSASSGTWTGSPTSYAYQWQDCSAAGASCTNVSGAAASSYTLGSSDVGHTVRVVVSASNAGGATPAASASVGPVSAPPPPPVEPAAPFRFFSPTSFWNQELPADAPLDPSSAGVVGAFAEQIAAAYETKKGEAYINTTAWSVPIYTVPDTQATVKVAYEIPYGGKPNPALEAAWSAVPLPPEAKPAAGTDRHLVVWQPSTDKLWEFWGLEKTETGWLAKWGGAIEKASSDSGAYGPEAWPGAQPGWGASASSLSIAGGLITLEDLEKGQINHALAISLPKVRAGVYASSAERTDGWSTEPLSLPEGAHLRLEPGLDLAALHLPKLTLMMAEAAQRYGIFVRDSAAEPVFYGQDPIPTGTEPYTGAHGYFEGKSPAQLLASFPWSHLQLLKMELHGES